VPGWSQAAEERMPHGWKAGHQTVLLKRQLDAVPDGGLIVVIAPENPYRCPPGPYERASMMAHVLKSTGRSKAHIIILDHKDKFPTQALFQQGWETYYPAMIEWLPPEIHGGIKRVDPATMTVETDFEPYKQAALVNVIPRQTAGEIAVRAGLTKASGYCAIDPFSMKSKADGNIFILGDAAIGGDMPKAAFGAHSQAQIAAQVIAAELLGGKVAEVSYQTRCWSLIETGDCVSVGGRYRPTPAKIEQTESRLSGMDDSAEQRRKNYEESVSWYAALTAELYG
jgi:NADPH-dependent 2,4-dienoyl-CoA reductase/sulfur reductase-like enzyme